MRYELIAPRRFGTSAIEQVLLNRGIAEQDVWHYLNTSDNDIINPATIDNIHRGAQMLIKHIVAGDKIFLQVD